VTRAGRSGAGGPRATLALAVAIALLAGCAERASGPAYPVDPSVQQIDLKWQPRAGMRLVYRVTTDVVASGPLTRPVPESDKTQHLSRTRSLEITDAGADYFDVRLVQDGWPLPATVRFSREWDRLDVKLDASVADDEKSAVDAASRQLGDLFAQGAQFFGPWKVGDSRPFEVRVSGISDASGGGQGSMTLRRVVGIEGRQAAEFDWKATTEFLFTGEPGFGAPGRMSITGKEWRDLATGASLRVTAKGDAEFTRQGQATRVAYQTDEVLDIAASRL